MAKHLNKVIDIENNTLAILHIEDMFVILQCVFHGIRLLRLRRIGCRETTNFFLPSPGSDFALTGFIFSIPLPVQIFFALTGVHFFYSLTCSNFFALTGF